MTIPASSGWNPAITTVGGFTYGGGGGGNGTYYYSPPISVLDKCPECGYCSTCGRRDVDGERDTPGFRFEVCPNCSYCNHCNKPKLRPKDADVPGTGEHSDGV